MNPYLFLEKLKLLSFDSAKLKEFGFSDDKINSCLRAFEPSRKNVESQSVDVLLRFIEEYETEFSLISNISFNEEIIDIGRFIHFGWVFEDLIAIDKTTNEIVSLTYWDYDNISFYCAESSSKFMEAFLEHGIGRLDSNFETDEDDWAFNLSQAKEAARVAGGEKYLKFWKSLYPTDDGKAENPNEFGFYN